MKSKITKTSYNAYFQTYEFETILGKATISKTSWRDNFILQTDSKGEHKDDNFNLVYFWCPDEAYKKLVELCDAEVDRVLKYLEGKFNENL